MTKSLEARIAQFNRLYEKQGGFRKYQEMKALGYTNVDIAQYFSVAQETVSRWSKHFAPKVDSLS